MVASMRGYLHYVAGRVAHCVFLWPHIPIFKSSSLHIMNMNDLRGTTCRVARRVLLKGDDVPVRGLASSLLRNVGLNLWGLGATIVGLQVGLSL